MALLAASTCFGGPALAQDTKAADQDQKQADDSARPVRFSGLLDFYYQYSMNHPPLGTNLFARAWDVKNDQFALSMLQLSATKDIDRAHPVGFKVVADFGKTADLIHFTDPDFQTVRNVQEAYGSVELSERTATSLDFGIFQAWACYDNIESTSTDNYSRSLPYTLGEPFYHAGVRFNTSLGHHWTGNLYLVNGWNDITDDNGNKTVGAMLMYTTRPIMWMVGYIGGDEGSKTANVNGAFGGIGFFQPLIANVQMVNMNGIWRPGRWKLSFNMDYAAASHSGGVGGHWSGQSVVVRYKITDAWAVAVRPERFEDTNGLRTGAAQNLESITATMEHRYRDTLVTKLEYRHDHAGTAFFPTRSGMRNNQDTLTIGEVVQF